MSQARQKRIEDLQSRVDALTVAGRLVPEDAMVIEELVSELALYKGELEAQNETLRETMIALKASRNRFERLFQQAPIGYAVLDPIGVIQDANEALVELTQTPRSQLIGRFLYRCLTPESASVFAVRLNSLLKSHPGDVRAMEGELRSADSTVPVRLILSWDAASGEENPCFLAAVVDMTMVRRREAELSRALEAAQAADRAKGEFLATMSHELRTPLNGILGMLQLLEETPLSEDQRLYTSQARNASRHLVRLLSDILEFARLDSGRPEPAWERFEVSKDVLAPVYGALHLEAETKGLDLHLDVAAGTPQGWVGDPGRLRQILLNLVGNAIKYTHQGEVRAQIGVSPKGLYLWVEDTGPGMDDDTLRRLFEPFQQGSRTPHVRGVGLGMAIVARLVRLLSGSLCVETGPQAGVCVVVAVPARPGGVPQEELQRAAVRVPIGQTCSARVRVLVVEDDPVNRLVAVRLLRARGYAVREASDGLEAMRWLEEECFDVILMDIQMPHLDGLETTRRIRESSKPYRHVAIVAMTAHALNEDRQRALDVGMNGYVSKPFDIQEVEDTIALAIAQSLQERSNP